MKNCRNNDLNIFYSGIGKNLGNTKGMIDVRGPLRILSLLILMLDCSKIRSFYYLYGITHCFFVLLSVTNLLL